MPKDVTIRFLGDTRHLEDSSVRVNATLGGLDGVMGKVAKVGAVLGGVTLGIGAGLGTLGLKAVQASAGMEQSRIAFTTMLGSAQAADSFLKQLQQFAANTPFEFVGLQASAKQLLAFGFNAKAVIPTMTAIGDAVSALGGGQELIDRVTMALGQMMSKGKVQSDEMLQLAEAGIPAWDMLAKKLGTDIPTAMKKVQDGAVDAKTGIDAITTGMEQRFGGMMQKQSTTIAGMWSNVQDSVGQTLTVIGDMITKAFDLKGKVAGLQNLLTTFQGFALALQQGQSPMMALIDLLEHLGISSSTLVQIEQILMPIMDGVGAAFQQLGQAVHDVWPTVQQLAGVFMQQLQPSLLIIAQHSDELKAVLLGLALAVGIIVAVFAGLVLAAFKVIAVFFQVKDAFDSALNGMNAAIGHFASTAPGLLYSAGQAVVQGFVNGIGSMAGAVSSAIQRIVTGPIDAAKNTLGIHSPSAVFRDIGKNVVLGFAEGLDTPMPAAAGSRSTTVNYNLGGVSAPAFTNPADVGRMVVSAIQEYERRSGSAWRA